MKKILLPTVFLGLSLGAFSQDVVFWDFNSMTSDNDEATGVMTPATGSGSISIIGGISQEFDGGTDDDPNADDNSALHTTDYPAQDNDPRTAGIVIEASTTGFENLTLEFWQRLSNKAANTWVLQYTADKTGASTGGTVQWTDAATYTFTPAASGTGDTWYFRSHDFSSVTALNNNPDAAFRVVSDFDPTAGEYLAARSTSTYDGGTSRFDLVRLSEATATPANVSIASAANFVVVQENAGIIQVPVTVVNANGSAVEVTIGLSTYTDATQTDDYTWVSTTLTIPASSNGTFDFPISIVDDNLAERAERIVVKLVSGTNANISATNNYQIIYIQDNDYEAPVPTNELNLSLLSSYSNGAPGDNSAEIVTYDATNQRLFIANSIGAKLDIVDFQDPANPTLIESIDITTYGNINSVVVHDGVVAMAIENSNAQDDGFVVFLNEDGDFISQVTVGAMPDMITFNKDYTKILTANEGEPDSDYDQDPEGSVSIVDLSVGYASLTNADVTTVGFTDYNGLEDDLRDQGIRVFSTSASVAQDFEPEYVTVSSDNTKAFVSLQENNALAVIDIATAGIDTIYALGYIDYSSGNGLDASNQSNAVLISSAPVKGAYMPDAISFATINGAGYVFSANEGDSREFGDVVDAARIADLDLDPVAFPDQHILKNNKFLGRLNGLQYSGDTDEDGDFDEIHVMGGRSFSIWSAATGELVFDSKDIFEQITASHPDFTALFNASNEEGAATLKNRSDDKGPEPEGVSTAVINGSHYLFVALERIGGVMTFNVNDPQNPVYVGYYNNRTLNGSGPDLGAEGIIHIAATDSPNGNEIVILANEVSSTLSIYQINTCAEVAGAVITADDAELCEGETATLTIDGEAGSTIKWLLDGEEISGETTTTLEVQEAGAYRVFVENTTFACSDTSVAQTIEVNTLPEIDAIVTADTICDGGSVTFTATGAATIEWNNNVVDGEPFTPTATDTYEVTGTDANGCETTEELTVVVNELPTVVAHVTDATACQGQAVIFSGSGAETYSWNNSVTDGAATVPTASGTYTVTGTDTNGCVNTDDIAITVSPLPTVSLGADITICENNAPAVLNAGAGQSGYNWSTGATTQSIEVSVSGNFSVTVTDANGCHATDVIGVTVEECLGLEENTLEARIFPNPTSGIVNFVFPSALSDAILVLTDAQGKSISSVNGFSGTETSIDLANVQSGVYFLTIRQSQQTAQYRIVKQ